jgi:hypothetical protein
MKRFLTSPVTKSGEYEMTNAAHRIDYPSTINETPVSAIVREMSISVERFSNRLAHVAGGILSEEELVPGRYKLMSSTGSITITCEKMENRHIGLLTIPVTNIKLDFTHYDASQIESFMRQFDRAYLKLGG